MANLLTGMAPNYIQFPNQEEQTRLKLEFYRRSRIPNVIGIIDGTHVQIIPPSEDEPSFVNRKQTHSVNVQVICDDSARFTDVVANMPGGAHDSFVFRSSHIYGRFLRGDFGNGKLLGTRIS